MNKRIRELALQASGGSHYLHTHGEPLQNFAEMIVRECITQINEAIPDTDCSASGAYKTAKIAAMAKVKDHFGIER